MLGGALGSWYFNHSGFCPGQDKSQHTGPPGLELGIVRTTASYKTSYSYRNYNKQDIGPLVDSNHFNYLSGNKINPDESQLEVRSVKESLLGPKTKLHFEACNVQTMHITSTAAQVLSGMKRYLEWEPVNVRLIRICLNSKFCKLTILQCYAPTNEAEEENKDGSYKQLQIAVYKVPQHDILLITGNTNAKVGNNNTNYERAMSTYGCGESTNSGNTLLASA